MLIDEAQHQLAFIAFGSNLGDRLSTIKEAARLIGIAIGPIARISKAYETTPVLHPEKPTPNQSDFLNCVGAYVTAKAPEEILTKLLHIEEQLGRVRDIATPWTPRTIDLDLIAVGQTVLTTPRLVIPHPRFRERRFVIEPLFEIAPNWQDPQTGLTVAQLRAELLKQEGPSLFSSPEICEPIFSIELDG